MPVACPAFKLHLSLLLLSLSLVLGYQNGGIAQVQAQEVSPALVDVVASPAAEEFNLNGLKTDYVWTKTSLTSEITNQRKIYRDQLEAYRQTEKNFIIAKDQYLKQDTLDAIEQAVKATRAMHLSRDQVLHTYLTLLQLRLMEAEGIEISLKTTLLAQVETLREQLKIHHASAIIQLDRPTANRLSDEFTPIGSRAQIVSSEIVGLLSLGKLQEIYDKAMVLSPDIKAEVTVASVDKAVSAETTRSLRETAGALAKTKVSLDLVWQSVSGRVLSGAEISGQSDFSQELNLAYVDLTRSLGFFLELLKLYRTAGAAAN